MKLKYLKEEKELKNYIEKLTTEAHRSVVNSDTQVIYKIKFEFERKMRHVIKKNSKEIEDAIKEIAHTESKLKNLKEMLSYTDQELTETSQLRDEFIILHRRYLVDLLKMGIDVRGVGLSWIVVSLLEINTSLCLNMFPIFLKQRQINYIILVSKLNLILDQLKMILRFYKETQRKKFNFSEIDNYDNLNIKHYLAASSQVKDTVKYNILSMSEKLQENQNLDEEAKIKPNPRISRLSFKVLNQYEDLECKKKLIDFSNIDEKRNLVQSEILLDNLAKVIKARLKDNDFFSFHLTKDLKVFNVI